MGFPLLFMTLYMKKKVIGKHYFVLDLPQLTLLGPGWFPLDISELEEPGLLGDLNLSKLGLKAASAVTDNSNNTSSGNIVIQLC